MPSPHFCESRKCDQLDWSVGGIRPNYHVIPKCKRTGESVYKIERCEKNE